MKLDDVGLIFLHAGKTAGSSVEDALFIKYYNKSHDFNPQVPNYDYMFGLDKSLRVYLQHADLSMYRKLGVKLEDYSTFTISRNPYTRLFSAFMYSLGKSKIVSRARLRERFNIFVDRELKKLFNRNSEYTANHFGPLLRFVEHEGYRVDNVYRFENIKEDLDWLGFKYYPKKLFKTRASYYFPNYMDVYDQKSIEIVNELYEDDFNKLDYKMI